jgi:SNF2 family DNA or RNA helicase
VLGGHDIVLASYNEVMRSYPCNVPPIELQTARQKTDWWEKTYQEQRGVLHRMFFKRVVLDEAQQIKNHQGRISIACRALMAEHRWALSGTPILNSLEELYPYFKFLGVPQTASFKIFKENYCGNGTGENAERLLARLSQFMIRRTHADRMFNAPILKLPQAIQITHWCEFNPVERSVYNIVHERFALNINKLSRDDALAKSYNNILTMLLRLRQLAAHPLMLQFVMRDLLEREDIEMIKDVVRDQAAAANVAHGRTILAIRKQLEAHEAWKKQKAVDKAKRRFAAIEAAKEAAKANGTEYVEPEDDLEANNTDDNASFELPEDGEIDGEFFHDRSRERNKSGKSFGKTYNFKPYLNSLAQGEGWQKKKERAKCGECGRHPTKPWTTSCGHLLCDTCYGDVMATAAEENRANGRCKACGTIFAACARCDEEDDDVPGPSGGTRNKAEQQRRREKERLNREQVADDWLSLGGPEVLPSAKTLAIKSQILNWISETPGVKIIIYTQFLAMSVLILTMRTRLTTLGSAF